MSRWRTLLFITLARNAADPSVRFGLPAQQTVVMGTRREIWTI
jgi:KUP system potassium uptake protein